MNIAEFIQKKNEVLATLPEKNREAYQKMVEVFLLQHSQPELYIFPDVGKHQHYVGIGASSKPLHFSEVRLLLKANEVKGVSSSLQKPEAKVTQLVDPLGRVTEWVAYVAPRQVVTNF